jgi:hypothetical protein
MVPAADRQAAPVSALIETHAWRPLTGSVWKHKPKLDRPCCFIGCGRPRAEHARSVGER